MPGPGANRHLRPFTQFFCFDQQPNSTIDLIFHTFDPMLISLLAVRFPVCATWSAPQHYVAYVLERKPKARQDAHWFPAAPDADWASLLQMMNLAQHFILQPLPEVCSRAQFVAMALKSEIFSKD